MPHKGAVLNMTVQQKRAQTSKLPGVRESQNRKPLYRGAHSVRRPIPKNSSSNIWQNKPFSSMRFLRISGFLIQENHSPHTQRPVRDSSNNLLNSWDGGTCIILCKSQGFLQFHELSAAKPQAHMAKVRRICVCVPLKRKTSHDPLTCKRHRV